MDHGQWLEVFRNIGASMRNGLSSIVHIEKGRTPLGKGAGGDRTFPIDKWAEDIILEELKKVHRRGESFTLISEELGVRKFGAGEQIVLADPIDGSNNAKNGVPFFATSLALLEGERLSDLQVGYISHLPACDEFWAVRGKGAYRNGGLLRTPTTQDIVIAAYEATNPARDFPRILPVLTAARRTRCFGATALDLAYLASGAVSVFATATPSRSFDYAAGMLVVEEADGVITDLEGNTIDHIVVGLDRTVPLLASKNEMTHYRVLSLLESPS